MLSDASINEQLAKKLGEVQSTNPLVHCITNYVTVNDCANALLAIGASPVMADELSEAAEIAAISSALVLNIGTLNARTIQAMQIAGKSALTTGIPILLDPVGAGASKIRTDTALNLITTLHVSVIRGNLSEAKTLLDGCGNTRGVDANNSDAGGNAFETARRTAIALAVKTGAVVAITGETDVISDGTRTFAVFNGHPLLPRITGSGCMLSAITGAFCGASRATASGVNLLESVTASLALMGLAGEIAASMNGSNRGTGSFRTSLIDALSIIDEQTLAQGMKIELLA